MALTEIILRENIPGLGAEADIVKVRKGFARNYLIPQAKAYEVTPANLKNLTSLKTQRAEREASELNAAQEIARKISKITLQFRLETGETGKAFGSVTAKDIEDKLRSESGVAVDRHRIQLDRAIKETGEQEISIRLHHDVTVTLKINVQSTTPKPSEEPVSDSTAKTKLRKKPRASA
jgi:large subunit ribosomal protein L9